jgi:hypothetical protein
MKVDRIIGLAVAAFCFSIAIFRCLVKGTLSGSLPGLIVEGTLFGSPPGLIWIWLFLEIAPWVAGGIGGILLTFRHRVPKIVAYAFLVIGGVGGAYYLSWLFASPVQCRIGPYFSSPYVSVTVRAYPLLLWGILAYVALSSLFRKFLVPKKRPD